MTLAVAGRVTLRPLSRTTSRVTIKVGRSRRSVLPAEVLEAARVREVSEHYVSDTRKSTETRTHPLNPRQNFVVYHRATSVVGVVLS